MNLTKRLAAVAIGLLAAGAALASTITVTSPAKGTLANPTPIKGTTNVNFNIVATPATDATEVTVTITLFRTDTNAQYGAPKIQKFTPNTDGKVSGSMQLKFSKDSGDPEITYRVEVRAKEVSRPNEVYNIDQNLFLQPDLTAPKILQFNPLPNAAVKGIVKITVQIEELNLKDWRVQVDGTDLPNGEGTTVDSRGRFSVDWDSTGVQFDGNKAVSIRIRDTADNETTQSITLTVDRVKPSISIATPQNNAVFSPGTNLIVTVDVRELNLSVTGVDVVIRTTAGAFKGRVARTGFQQTGQNTFRWTGRIRWRSGFLPSQFKIVASSIDRAGNAGTPQTVTVRIGG